MTYQTGHSVLHRLHPVVKLAWLLWVTVAVFVFHSVALPLAAVGLALALLWLAGVPPWRIPGARACLILGVGIVVLHAVVARHGEPLIGPVTTVGLVNGLRAAGRLLAVILMSTLFVTTTEPVSLACALVGAGLPYRWGFALVTALRLAPVFRVEAHHVHRAQLVRGVAYDAWGPRRWWLILRHLCMPLLVSALRTAHSLSLSMEGRAFGLHRRRTSLRQVNITRLDVAIGALLLLSIGAASWYAIKAT
ncbi:MAG TPA: energy-coupling factor transporter transmembrane component T [Phycisphaerae bacterium]|nr:energy-coupling factor transporter transmembrane component T [Phycisphaerae bacterium]